jgi:hypothetical protein
VSCAASVTPLHCKGVAATILFAILTSALGMAYMIYGKRQAKFAPLIAGLGLCFYTYFVDGWLWLGLIGAALAALPFVVDF